MLQSKVEDSERAQTYSFPSVQFSSAASPSPSSSLQSLLLPASRFLPPLRRSRRSDHLEQLVGRDDDGAGRGSPGGTGAHAGEERARAASGVEHRSVERMPVFAAPPPPVPFPPFRSGLELQLGLDDVERRRQGGRGPSGRGAGDEVGEDDGESGKVRLRLRDEKTATATATTATRGATDFPRLRISQPPQRARPHGLQQCPVQRRERHVARQRRRGAGPGRPDGGGDARARG